MSLGQKAQCRMEKGSTGKHVIYGILCRHNSKKKISSIYGICKFLLYCPVNLTEPQLHNHALKYRKYDRVKIFLSRCVLRDTIALLCLITMGKSEITGVIMIRSEICEIMQRSYRRWCMNRILISMNARIPTLFSVAIFS